MGAFLAWPGPWASRSVLVLVAAVLVGSAGRVVRKRSHSILIGFFSSSDTRAGCSVLLSVGMVLENSMSSDSVVMLTENDGTVT